MGNKIISALVLLVAAAGFSLLWQNATPAAAGGIITVLSPTLTGDTAAAAPLAGNRIINVLEQDDGEITVTLHSPVVTTTRRNGQKEITVTISGTIAAGTPLLWQAPPSPGEATGLTTARFQSPGEAGEALAPVSPGTGQSFVQTYTLYLDEPCPAEPPLPSPDPLLPDNI